MIFPAMDPINAEIHVLDASGELGVRYYFDDLKRKLVTGKSS